MIKLLSRVVLHSYVLFARFILCLAHIMLPLILTVNTNKGDRHEKEV